MSAVEIRHGHLFCGLGGGAKGFNRARPVVGTMRGVFRCIGGIDVDPAGIRDFEHLSGVRGTVLDLFDREQWRERIGNAVPSDAATAIAEVMGETLLLARAGETFMLSARPVWVRPLQIALSVRSA